MVSVGATPVRVDWSQTYRIIRSIYPPIDLFEDVADPADWEAITASDAKVNGAMSVSVGDLSKVPAARRVTGAGASWVMVPFVHCSTLRPGRFTDGSYGIYYAGDSVTVALAETIHHHQVMMAATAEEPGWTSDFRVLVGSIDHELDDVDAVPGVRDPVNYGPSQIEGAALRAAGSDGVTWESVRQPGGRCIGVFWPDVVTIPVQGAHYMYHWDGARVDRIWKHDTRELFNIV